MFFRCPLSGVPFCIDDEGKYLLSPVIVFFQISSVLTRLYDTPFWFSYKKDLEMFFSVSLEV